MGYEIFISYSSKDKKLADAIVAKLENMGKACWVAPRDIRPGSEWGAAIIEGIEQCKVMILLFTNNSNSSPQVLREVERAVSKGLVIIPLRIENTPLSLSLEYFISAVHWLDAITKPIDDNLDRIIMNIISIIDAATQGKSIPHNREKLFKHVSGKYINKNPVEPVNPKLLITEFDPGEDINLIIINHCETLFTMHRNEEGKFQLEGDTETFHQNIESDVIYFNYSKNNFKFNSDLITRNRLIKGEFGPTAEHASFEDLREISEEITAARLIDNIGLREIRNPEIIAYDGVEYWNQGPFVTYKGQVSEGSRAFFVSVHDGILIDDWRIVDTIEHNNIDLGSWHNNRRALVKITLKAVISCSDNNLSIKINNNSK